MRYPLWPIQENRETFKAQERLLKEREQAMAEQASKASTLQVIKMINECLLLHS